MYVIECNILVLYHVAITAFIFIMSGQLQKVIKMRQLWKLRRIIDLLNIAIAAKNLSTQMPLHCQLLQIVD